MNLGAWVPQFFYDLIGRVVPGSVVLFSALVVFDEVTVADGTAELLIFGARPDALQMIVGGLLASYTAGMLLNGASWLPIEELKRVLSLFRSSEPLDPMDAEEVSDQWLRTFPNDYEFVQFYSPRIGARVAKLAAETAFGRVLAWGLGILAAVYLIWSPDQHWGATFWQTESALIGLTLLAYLTQRHFQRRHRRSARNQSMLIRNLHGSAPETVSRPWD